MGKPKRTQNLDYAKIQNFYDSSHTWEETATEFDISDTTCLRLVRKGLLISRNRSVSAKFGHRVPRTHTDESKKLLSDIMIERHKNGTAHNIGQSRWNNEPSYPEKFFMQVIENEFEDKNYVREHPMSIYSLDFAWLHLKKCIEIDGDQHQRFDKYKERDAKKDICIEQAGWQVLRIVWKEMYHNTKDEIKKCKDFIENRNI